MTKSRLLIVEDNRIVAEDLKHKLELLGYSVVGVATTGKKALNLVQKQSPDIILMDIQLGKGMNGIDTAAEINRLYQTPIIYLTAYADDKTIARVKLTEPHGYLIKPFDTKELQSTIEIAIYKHKIELKLKESEQWLAKTLASIGDGVVATDAEGGVKFMNPIAENLTGWKQSEAFGRPLEEVFIIINEETREPVDNPVRKVLQTGQIIGLANHTLLINKNGEEIPIKDSGAPICLEGQKPSGVVLVFQDDSNARETEKKIKASLAEKEVLLKEVHHRVKNNLQVILSLLQLQSDRLQDAGIIGIIKEIQHRVNAMAMIHDQLYQSDNLARIEFKSYIEKLIQIQFRTYGIDSKRITFDLQTEDVHLDVDTATPLGLIISELVSNALKYAFPDNRNGELSICLKETKEHCELIVMDNGIGFPGEIDLQSTDSFGLHLVRILVNLQLNGELSVSGEEGSRFLIKFKLP